MSNIYLKITAAGKLFVLGLGRKEEIDENDDDNREVKEKFITINGNSMTETFCHILSISRLVSFVLF